MQSRSRLWALRLSCAGYSPRSSGRIDRISRGRTRWRDDEESRPARASRRRRDTSSASPGRRGGAPDRQGGPTRTAGPRSPTPTAPRRRRPRRSSSCTCCGRPAGGSSGPTCRSPRCPPRPRARSGWRRSTSDRPGKTPRENCEEFAPLIAEAAKQKADLVVLGETLTYFGTGKSLRGLRRADPRPVHGVLRRAGEEAQPVHRRRPARARPASGLQRRRAARPGRQRRRQVSQGVPAARRGRARHRAGERVPGLRHAVRQGRHDGLLRRLLPGGGPRTDRTAAPR